MQRAFIVGGYDTFRIVAHYRTFLQSCRGEVRCEVPHMIVELSHREGLRQTPFQRRQWSLSVEIPVEEVKSFFGIPYFPV